MVSCCINQHHNQPGGIWCGECESLLEGALIGDYRVISHISNGSSSDVYLAEQHSLNHRRVVIKILHRSCNQRHVKNFRREAALIATLSHPYILPIFSYGVIYERQTALATCLPYLVLPFAEQGSLTERFVREGKRPWSLERVVSLTREVAEALDYAHSRGVLHRDVKPANLLQMGSHVLLSDFSVASLIDVDSSHLNVAWAGSPAFMAPEVWGLHPGRYSDQYALAVTCFFLLTGDYPLRKNGETDARSWQHLHCFVAPSSLNNFRAGIPPAVDLVLQRALAKNPHERYPTVQAFATDLLGASQDVTQPLDKMAGLGLAAVTRWRPAPGNVQTGEQEWREPQRIGVALADVPATDPIAAPVVSPVYQGRKEVAVEREDVRTEILNNSSQGKKWTWYALLLNLLICLVLAGEYAWQMGRDVEIGAGLLLALWPALLVGPLLARFFRRIPLTTFARSLFWGVCFGLANALLSALACFAWKAFLFVMPFSGNAGAGLSDYFQQTLALELLPGVVELTLLALWMSVIGGALIGIFSERDEGAVPSLHQGSRK